MASFRRENGRLTAALKLSKLNMLGMGAKMMRGRMKALNIDSLVFFG